LLVRSIDCPLQPQHGRIKAAALPKGEFSCKTWPK
jgi:hypothetical protein